MNKLDDRVEDVFNSLKLSRSGLSSFEVTSMLAGELADSSFDHFWRGPQGEQDIHKKNYIAARLMGAIALAGSGNYKAAQAIADAELTRIPYRAHLRGLDLNITLTFHLAVATISAYGQKRQHPAQDQNMEMVKAGSKKFDYCVDRVVERALRTEAADLRVMPGLRPDNYGQQEKMEKKAAIKETLYKDLSLYLGIDGLSRGKLAAMPITGTIDQLEKNVQCLNPGYSSFDYRMPRLPVLAGLRKLLLAEA